MEDGRGGHLSANLTWCPGMLQGDCGSLSSFLAMLLNHVVISDTAKMTLSPECSRSTALRGPSDVFLSPFYERRGVFIYLYSPLTHTSPFNLYDFVTLARIKVTVTGKG